MGASNFEEPGNSYQVWLQAGDVCPWALAWLGTGDDSTNDPDRLETLWKVFKEFYYARTFTNCTVVCSIKTYVGCRWWKITKLMTLAYTTIRFTARAAINSIIYSTVQYSMVLIFDSYTYCTVLHLAANLWLISYYEILFSQATQRTVIFDSSYYVYSMHCSKVPYVQYYTWLRGRRFYLDLRIMLSFTKMHLEKLSSLGRLCTVIYGRTLPLLHYFTDNSFDVKSLLA